MPSPGDDPAARGLGSIAAVAQRPRLALLCALVLALSGAGVAGAATAPRAAPPLPALHEVAGWVASGLKEKAATASIVSQLSANEYGWIPESQCLTDAIGSTNATPCVLGDAASPTTVVLLGDSSADQWALDLGWMGTKDGFRVVVYVHAACPVGAITIELEGQSPDSRCATFQSLSLSDLAAMRPAPALVVVSELRLANYRTSSGAWVTDEAWSSALTTTLEAIEGDGDPVAVLHGVPVTSTANPAGCIAAYPKAMTRCTTRRKDADPYGFDQATLAGTLAADAAGVDVAPLFCSTAACPVVSKDDITHAGDNHATERYAAAVRAGLAELIGCSVTQSFSHRAAATTVLRSLLGGSPSAAVLAACRALSP